VSATEIRDQLVALASLLDSGHLDDVDIITAQARSFAEALVLVYGDEQTGLSLAVPLRLSPRDSYRGGATGGEQRRWIGVWDGVAVELTVAVKGGGSS
jgi:hypothetical protein